MRKYSQWRRNFFIIPGWGGYAPYFRLFQSTEWGKFLFPTFAFLISFLKLLLNNLSDFCLLQYQCASCRLFISLGWPPFDIGIIWSIHGDKGSGYFLEKSTGLPQIPQTVCVAYIFLLFLSKTPRWVPSLSGLGTLMFSLLYDLWYYKTPAGWSEFLCIHQKTPLNNKRLSALSGHIQFLHQGILQYLRYIYICGFYLLIQPVWYCYNCQYKTPPACYRGSQKGDTLMKCLPPFFTIQLYHMQNRTLKDIFFKIK